MPTEIRMPDSDSPEDLSALIRNGKLRRQEIAAEIMRERKARPPAPSPNPANAKLAARIRSGYGTPASVVAMPDTNEGTRVKVGALIVHERADDGPMKYGRRAVVTDATGRRIFGESALLKLYDELRAIRESAPGVPNVTKAGKK